MANRIGDFKMANNKEHVVERYVTPKGELVGFIALVKPSTKYNKKGVYTTNILLSKEDGEYLTEKIKSIQKEQFKKYGKGTKLVGIPIKPYTTINEEGEEIEDSQGRYILAAHTSAYIENGKIGKRLQLVNAKLEKIKDIKIGEGTIARLGVNLSGYSVAGKTGVSAKLGLVQIIELVEYSSGFSLDGFEEEEGYAGIGEDYEINEEVATAAEETSEDGESEELDF